jgi:hypothetical protein
MSWKMLGLALAAGMVFATAEVRAMPLTHGLKGVVGDDVITVADGCGRGWRWSHRRGRCVPAGGPVVHPGAAVIVAPGIGIGVVGPGHHHRRHHRRHH